MIVFKYFLRLVWRFKKLILIQVAVFLMFTFISTQSGPSANQEFNDTPLTIAIVVPKTSPIAEDFIAYLSEKNKVTRVDADEKTLREQVYTDAIDGAIILPENMERTVMEQLSDVQVIVNEQIVSASVLKMDVNQYFTFAHAVVKSGEFDAERLRHVLNQQAETEIITRNGVDQGNYTLIWGKNYFNMLGYMFIMLFMSLLGVIMADFEGAGVTIRQKISALSLVRINRQKFLGGAVTVAGLFAVFIAFAICIQPSLLRFHELYHYIAIAVVSALTILSLTYLCITIAGDKKIVYNSLSTVLGLGLAFTSGVFVPIEFIGEGVQQFAKLFPLYYLVQANAAVVQHESYLQPLLIMVLFMLTYFVMALTIARAKQR